MSKIVKLKDQGSTFYDAAQRKGVVRDAVVMLAPTSKVLSALQGGALVEATEQELTAYTEAKAQAERVNSTIEAAKEAEEAAALAEKEAKEKAAKEAEDLAKEQAAKEAKAKEAEDLAKKEAEEAAKKVAEDVGGVTTTTTEDAEDNEAREAKIAALNELTIDGLKELCKEKGIDFSTFKVKAAYVEALVSHK